MENNMKHLTKQQIEELTLRLTERTRFLAARVREELAASDAQHYRDLAGSVTDTADEALASALVDVDTEIINRHVVELRDIESARLCMKNATYGVCIDCSDAVPYERLAVYPTAKRCVRCQQQREHLYASPGRPTL
jgi:DnaK suppressor protein